MKTLFAIFISLLFFTSCKKYVNACTKITELKDTAIITDLMHINAPELMDTLNKYPELELDNFNSNNYYWSARCKVYYKELLIFSDNYVLYKYFTPDTVFANEPLGVRNISISTEPSVSHTDAIKVAKKRLNFDHTCIYYRLGLYNINFRFGKTNAKDYKLVWKVQGTNGYPYVLVDANSKEVIAADDGIRYGWID